MKRIIGILAIILAVIPILACGSMTEPVQVKYEITGTAAAVDITYTNETGGTSQLSHVALPWSLEFEGKGLDLVSVMGQNNGETGTITTTIYKDGESFKTSTSDGAYVCASASGVF